jgi:hypothetical protein
LANIAKNQQITKRNAQKKLFKGRFFYAEVYSEVVNMQV